MQNSLFPQSFTPAYVECFSNLYLIQFPCAFHPTGNINRVPPDIILRFMGSDNSCDHWAVVYSCGWIKKKNDHFCAQKINYYFNIKLSLYIPFVYGSAIFVLAYYLR